MAYLRDHEIERNSCVDVICVIVVLIILFTRVVDENGMDEYDKNFGIAKEGLTRGKTGIIYRNGEYSLWDNLFDHNPYHSYW